MSHNGQKRSARKQKNKVKLHQKRSKMNAKQSRRNEPLQQNHFSDRIMNISDVINSMSQYCYNSILKNEEKSPRRRPSSSMNSVYCCTSPSIFNDPDLVNVFKPTLQQIHDFMKIIFEKRRLAAETGVMGFVLLIRSNMKITSANWMRLVLVSLLLANKEAEDVYTVWNVRFVGIIPNLQVYEINLLEMEFLQSIKYRLHVEPDNYQNNYQHLLSFLPTTTTQHPCTDLPSDPEETLLLSDSETTLMTESECSLTSNSESDLLRSDDEESIDNVIESPPPPRPHSANTEEESIDKVTESPPPPRPHTTNTEEDTMRGGGCEVNKYEGKRMISGKVHDMVHDLSPVLIPGELTENVSQIESIP